MQFLHVVLSVFHLILFFFCECVCERARVFLWLAGLAWPVSGLWCGAGAQPVSPSQGHQGATLDWTHQGSGGEMCVQEGVAGLCKRHTPLRLTSTFQCKDEGKFKQKCL